MILLAVKFVLLVIAERLAVCARLVRATMSMTTVSIAISLDKKRGNLLGKIVRA